MGPENSTDKVQLYMMVDGQPVELRSKIAEVKLPEGQQSNDILDFGKCEITVQIERPPVPLVHGRMIYRCEQCGRSWAMFLEKGIEEFGENHKPSPFTIGCPYCGGWAMDISGIQKIPGGYIPLPDGENYFANMENRECGVPVFCAERLQESETQALIADAEERLKRREMEMLGRAFRAAGIDLDRLAASVEKICAAMVIYYMELEKAMEQIAKIVQARLIGSAREIGELVALAEKMERLELRAKQERKENRERSRATERANAARFSQYKTKESTWAAGKRTGPRRREWRGPWKER